MQHGRYDYDLDKLRPEKVKEITEGFEAVLERVLGRPDPNARDLRRRVSYPTTQAGAHAFLCHVSAMPARNVFEKLFTWRAQLTRDQRELRHRANSVLSKVAFRAFRAECKRLGVDVDFSLSMSTNEFASNGAYRAELKARFRGHTLTRNFDVPKEDGIRTVKAVARELAGVLIHAPVPPPPVDDDDDFL